MVASFIAVPLPLEPLRWPQPGPCARCRYGQGPPSCFNHQRDARRRRAMTITTPGITPAGDGLDGPVWNILGQTYYPKQESESSFASQTYFPVGKIGRSPGRERVCQYV